jgi:membrane associated rhomboid family serine protease
VSRRQRFQVDREQLRITKGAAILLFVELGFTLVFMLVDKDVQARWAPWVVPSASTVWRHGHVWTLVTGAFLEPDLLSLFLQALMLWLFVPALERWWGTPRFLRFAAYTTLAGMIVGTLAGVALGRDVPMVGLDPFIWASVVAFGIIYARQPVQFFGVMPITGRQLMYGTLAFVALFILLQGAWEQGAGYAASIGLAVLLTNQRWNPRLAWLRWKKKRERAHLSVLIGGKGGSSKGKSSKKKPEQWLN